jgi:hypothetical protein
MDDPSAYGGQVMRAKDVQIGGRYWAKVLGKLVVVRVDAVRDGSNGRRRYDVTNTATGRTTTFRSATRLRHIAS